MLLKTYTRDEITRAMCNSCGWVMEKSTKILKRDNQNKIVETCFNCKGVYYTEFPYTQSGYILGGMIHFIESYNKKITGPRHIFPPEVYLPIIFACSNYETSLSGLVLQVINKYGKYFGRLARFMLFEETLSRYDRRTNEKLFKQLTGVSFHREVQNQFPSYISQLDQLYQIRNQVTHGKEIDNSDSAFSANKGIENLILSVDVFRYLHNKFVCKFYENIEYRRILRLGDEELFDP